MLSVAAATITSMDMELYRVVPEESSFSVLTSGCGVGVVVVAVAVVVMVGQLSGGGVTIPVNGGREK